MSIHWPIIRRLLADPLRTVMVDDRRRAGYRGIDLLAAAMHVAAAVAPRCGSGTLGVLLPTSGAFPIAALAGWILGKTVVPLNYLLKPEELRYVLDDCGADTVITTGPLLDAMGGGGGGGIGPRPEAPGSSRTQATSDSGLGPGASGPRTLLIEDIPFAGVPEARWPALASDSDLALLLYTSGTSGRPKGVMLTHGNITANIRQIASYVQFTRDDVLMGVLPQFHAFGLTVLTLLPLTIGCRTIYLARFSPHGLVRLLREHRPTVLIAIPSMYNALLHVKDATAADFASLRYVVSGSEPLPAAVAQGFVERYGVTISEGYGLTETSPVANWCRPHEHRPRSVGPPLPGVVERIVDLVTGEDLPPGGEGGEGEVRIAGPNVMRGYFGLPAETAAAFDERGFLRTGDIGRSDRDGHLSITGRLKEMLKVGGENVFPREIEEVLNRHPAVKDSGVTGAPDPVRGELPIAFVELREGMTVTEKDLIAHCRAALAGYKVPREARIVPDLPRNPMGKVLRRELKKLL